MTARSQGIFLYAQMLTDLLRSRGTLGATEEYPDGLDAVFTRWFSWFFNDSDFRSFWRPAPQQGDPAVASFVPRIRHEFIYSSRLAIEYSG